MAADQALRGKHFVPRKILVPVDFSGCSGAVLQHALDLGNAFQARITVLHVVEPALHAGNYVSVDGGLDPLNHDLVEAARAKLQQFARETAGQKIQVDTLVRFGRAYSEIPDTAEALGADLIVVGICGRTSRNPAALGSTVDRVVRHSSCPVLTVRCAVACPPQRA